MRKLIGFITFLITLLIPSVAHTAISDVDKATLTVTNLLSNGGFEGGLVGWQVSGGAKQIITTPATSIGSGKSALSWDASAAGQHVLSDVITVPGRLAGKTGAVWCYVQTPSGNSTHQLTVMAADGTTPLRTAITVDSQLTYTSTGSTFTFPVSGGVRLHLESVAANEPSINVDDCWISDATGTIFHNQANIDAWTSFTPTGSWTTNTQYFGKVRYTGDTADVELRVNLNGSPGTSALTINLPFTIDTTKTNHVGTYGSDSATFYRAGSGAVNARIYPSATSVAAYWLKDFGAQLYDQLTETSWGAAFSSGSYFVAKASYPVLGRPAQQAIRLDQQIDFTSAIFMYPGTCPAGTITADGKSIGKASGNFQGANYFSVYSKLWALPGLSTTAGDPFRISSAKGGSAQADWDALKTITVDFASNELFMRQKGAGTTLGAYQTQATAKNGLTNSSSLVTGSATSSTTGISHAANMQFGVGTQNWGAGASYQVTVSSTLSDPGHTHSLSGTAAAQTITGDAETRPKNVALNYCLNPSMVAPQPVIVFKAPTSQKLTASSGSYTTPAGVSYLHVRAIGGGGGGAGSGTGSGSAAGAGGQTTFSTIITANGGAAGIWGGSNPSPGGTASFSSPAFGNAIQGATGGGSQYQNAQVYGLGGQGASSQLGGGGGGGGYSGPGSSAIPFTGAAGGGGGSTSVSNVYTGSGGSAGGYVDVMIPSPAPSYSFTVGIAGTAGGAGANGMPGGTGGSGVIIVDEFYQ